MPELPEVHTTATLLEKLVKGQRITDVWTDYKSLSHKGKDNIKDPKFFAEFKKRVVNSKIAKCHRRGKNVLIDLDNGETILIHMKMTGHVLYGKYEFDRTWKAIEPESLKDPFNQFLHLVFTLSNSWRIALSDVRKFAKVTVIKTSDLHSSEHLADIGPEPLEAAFTFPLFKERLLLRPKGKVKQVLMTPQIMAGIGNIYSDEILWASHVHPESVVSKIPEEKLKEMYRTAKIILKKGIDFGGDSTSDYRNPYGERGQFHYHHKAYRNTGKNCELPNCKGNIKRIRMGGRGAHFCDVHQILYAAPRQAPKRAQRQK